LIKRKFKKKDDLFSFTYAREKIVGEEKTVARVSFKPTIKSS
jgi:hypothetical protein